MIECCSDVNFFGVREYDVSRAIYVKQVMLLRATASTQDRLHVKEYLQWRNIRWGSNNISFLTLYASRWRIDIILQSIIREREIVTREKIVLKFSQRRT